MTMIMILVPDVQRCDLSPLSWPHVWPHVSPERTMRGLDALGRAWERHADTILAGAVKKEDPSGWVPETLKNSVLTRIIKPT